jgi:predicted nucleic acid-binding protein
LAPSNQTANRWRVLIDVNVLLDVFARREPFYEDASRVWALAENGQIEGCIAGHSYTRLHYLIGRQISREMATWAIQQILKVFSVAEINGTVLENAIMLGWADFEDALQATAAQGAACNYVITRNTRDFDNQPLVALRPADFLAIWASGGE